MNFEIFTKNYVVDKSRLKEAAKAAFSKYLAKESQIELVFVDEIEIRELNLKYRKIDSITDVLSFKIENKPFIGQIFICYNRAEEQAKQSNIDVNDEIQSLFIHGLAHLLGHDHENEKDLKKMTEVETIIKKGEND